MIDTISIMDILNIKDVSVIAVLIAFIIYLIYVNHKSLAKIEDSIIKLRESAEASLSLQREATKELLDRLDKRENLMIELIKEKR